MRFENRMGGFEEAAHHHIYIYLESYLDSGFNAKF